MKKRNESNNRAVIMCALADTPDPVVPGSTIQKCAECGRRVLVSAETWRKAAAANPKLLCVDCVALMAGEEQIPMASLNDDELRAIAEALNVEATGPTG